MSVLARRLATNSVWCWSGIAAFCVLLPDISDGGAEMAGDRGRQHRASQSCDLFVRQTFRFCDRESLALFLKGYPSHVVCVISIKRIRRQANRNSSTSGQRRCDAAFHSLVAAGKIPGIGRASE